MSDELGEGCFPREAGARGSRCAATASHANVVRLSIRRRRTAAPIAAVAGGVRESIRHHCLGCQRAPGLTPTIVSPHAFREIARDPLAKQLARPRPNQAAIFDLVDDRRLRIISRYRSARAADFGRAWAPHRARQQRTTPSAHIDSLWNSRMTPHAHCSNVLSKGSRI